MKKRYVPILCLLCLVLLTGFVSVNQTGLEVNREKKRQAEDFGKPARQYLQELALKYSDRLTGTAKEEQAAGYIQAVFEKIGYTVKKQSFTFQDADDGSRLKSNNLIAIKPGQSNEQIVVGAHYDSAWGSSQGADDNASGVAVMLEAAQRVKTIDTPYTIVFVAFGAEENDLDGSTYYVESIDGKEIQNIVLMINLDGLIAGDFAYMYGQPGRRGVYEWLTRYARDEGLDIEPLPSEELSQEDGSPCECSDFDAFEYEEIPFLFFEATNWNIGEEDGETQVSEKYGDHGIIRHTRYDSLQYIESTFPGRIDHHLNLFGRLTFQVLSAYTG